MKEGMKLAVILMGLLVGVFPSFGWTAPLSQGNRFPLMLMVLTPDAESPDLPKNRMAVSLDVDYTSVYVNKQSDRWNALIDMELATITPGLEWRLGERISVGYYLPLVHLTGGFLDRYLADYHEAGNFPDYGRSHRPDNAFAYSVTQDGLTWFDAQSGGIHLADSRLNLKYKVVDGEDSALSLMYSAKLPTGDDVMGLGSGHVDHGLFLLGRIRKGPATWYLNPGLILPDDPETLGADVSFHNMACLFLGIEYDVSNHVGLNAQLNIFESPLEDTGIRALDNACVELAFGLNWMIRPVTCLEATFNEDLSGPSPDFTVRTGVRLDIGI